MFTTYIYTDGTNINGIASMGIYGVADAGCYVAGSDLKSFVDGDFVVSYIEDVTFGNMAVKKYDFYFEATGEDGNVYYGTIQLPVLGINKAAYDKDPTGEGVFFATTDNGYLHQAESGSFNANYSYYEITTQELQQYGTLYLYGENTKTGVPSSMSLQFVVGKNAQRGLGIPAGVYPIDNSGNVGTVSASVGLLYGSPIESYATTYVYSGGNYYVDAHWYLASGTVTVGEEGGKLKVTVDARTNNNLPVYAVFYENNSQTPIPNNVITYTAEQKLPEVTGMYDHGLHTYAFNAAITSHTFSDGKWTITFADELTMIGERAFSGCSGLTSVTIPSSVTTIENDAFIGCSGLHSVTIPSSVTTIGGWAFGYCTGLTSVTIPSSVTTIGVMLSLIVI